LESLKLQLSNDVNIFYVAQKLTAPEAFKDFKQFLIFNFLRHFQNNQ